MNESEVIIPVVLFIAIAAILISYITSKHRERMAIITKGMASDDIKAIYTHEIKRSPLGSLKWGILFVMAGLAVLVGNYLRDRFYVEDGVVIGLVCLFVGIGLVLFYALATKKIGQPQ